MLAACAALLLACAARGAVGKPSNEPGTKVAFHLVSQGAGNGASGKPTAGGKIPSQKTSPGATGKSPQPGASHLKLSPAAAAPNEAHNSDKLLGNWFGFRNTLDRHGIELEGSITGDFSKSFYGGLRTNIYPARYLLDIGLTIHTDKLFHWRGGQLYVDMQNREGPNAQLIETGNLQGFSNIDAYSGVNVPRLWYEQKFWHKHLRLRIGEMYVDDQFLYPDYGQDFLNPSMAHDPTVFVLPTFPLGAVGFDGFLYPVKGIYIAAGIFDGHLHNVLPYDPGGVFSIFEAGLRWKIQHRLKGRFKFGIWNHTGTLQTLQGGNVSSTNGWYIVVSQALWRASDRTGSPNAGAFLQVGHAQGNVSDITGHVGAGLAWTGPFPTRPADELGVGFTYARTSPEGGFQYNFENDYELFYKIQATSSVIVQPDLQYIQHPGAGPLPDALVGTIRIIANF